MPKLITSIVVPVILSIIALDSLADEAVKRETKVNEKCPITGKAVSPDCTTEYEDVTYAFCSDECSRKFIADRSESLYHKIGGKAAIGAAVDLFYKKVLADERVDFFFEDVNMARQHNKQKAFIGAALGGPEPWTGKDMRQVHASLDIRESEFNAIAEHLQNTLEELQVEKELIDQVMAIIGSTKDDILNNEKKQPE